MRYRGRNVAERSFGWLKKFRRFSTGYDNLARSFAAFIKRAFCFRYLLKILMEKKSAILEHCLGSTGSVVSCSSGITTSYGGS